MSNKQKKLPTRRDLNEARGYLSDLFATDDSDGSAEAEHLIEHAVELKVQRATDRLVLYFDLDDDGNNLPEATTGADGIDNGGEKIGEWSENGLSEFAGEADK